jgi:hypothetical protein
MAEVLKRSIEYVNEYISQIKYRNPARCRYGQFIRKRTILTCRTLPGFPVPIDWKHYRIFSFEFDLTKPINWHFSENSGHSQWPACHYSTINYRPGNPYGDIRINWELNRLQFLPALAISDESLAKTILIDWLDKNPYLHGPGYLASMEVALRWFSIYWAICLFEQPLDAALKKTLTGFAASSGRYIESRLSSGSSAGNHLIVEAVGLFWLGKSLRNSRFGIRWISKARKILWEQIKRQINPDGSNREQSFWYLGFVIDAILHYVLLEQRAKIPSEVWYRIEKALEFTHDMILPDGSFPDYGDRDDGVVFRLNGQYAESPFPGLLNTGAFLYNRPEWFRNCKTGMRRRDFWMGNQGHDNELKILSTKPVDFDKPRLKTYPHGGMTLMQWANSRALFRHAPLGLENTFGHGHADALSVILFWDNIPVLIDLGSGQYNNDQHIRNFFRSTIAHNTIEIGGKNQARILGPFMWEKSYATKLEQSGIEPNLHAQAIHNGYLKTFSITHTRRVDWLARNHLNIRDFFSGSYGVSMRGAFHLGHCRSVSQDDNIIEADFKAFKFSIIFPADFSIRVYNGSKDPFMGWRSTIYGKWEPIHSIIFSSEIQMDHQYDIFLKIL